MNLKVFLENGLERRRWRCNGSLTRRLSCFGRCSDLRSTRKVVTNVFLVQETVCRSVEETGVEDG